MINPRSCADAARVPRALHPLAWWAWAGGLAVAAERTDNPLLLALILAVLVFVVRRRRGDAPWARAFPYYAALALTVIMIRVGFRVIFTSGAYPGDHVVLRLPHVPLPHWYAGVSVGGPVSLEGTLSAAYDGLRLATLLCCVGAANVLANPRRVLRMLPGALYELGTAVVVALTVAPQLIESIQRVRRARRLRAGRTRGLRSLPAVFVPVLEDAFERSLALAASMDSRGYGRTNTAAPRTRRLAGTLLVAGLLGTGTGTVAVLDGSAPRILGLPVLAAGAALSAAGLALGGRRIRRSRYRPDPWRAPEWVVGGLGLAAAVALLTAGPDALAAPVSPLGFPALPVLPAGAVLLAALAGLAAPPPEPVSRAAPARRHRREPRALPEPVTT